MNLHIRDNLNYLKGNAGQVAISAGITATAGASSEDTLAARSGNSAQYAAVSVGRTAGEVEMAVAAGAGHFFNQTVAGDAVVKQNDAAKKLYLGAGPNGSAETVTITTSRVGIGTIDPQGKLHGYNAISGFMHYEFDGVDGTARTVIPNGTGDVLYVASGFYVARSSAPSIQAGNIGAIAPGVSTNIGTWGGSDVLQFQVAANGAITVQRTGGSLTYKVALWIVWL
jgi:hypothetical protein